MKKSILAIALVGMFGISGAYAEGCCSAGSYAVVNGNIQGSANSSVSATSSVVGTGTSYSNAGSGSSSQSYLNTTATTTNDGQGHAAADVSMQSGTLNQVYTFANNTSTGHGTGSASADASAEAGVSAWSITAAGGNGVYVEGGFGFDHGSDANSNANAHKNKAGDSGAYGYSAINAVGGVAVTSCNDVKNVSGYVADSKAAETGVRSTGHSTADAGAGAEFGGGYEGVVSNYYNGEFH